MVAVAVPRGIVAIPCWAEVVVPCHRCAIAVVVVLVGVVVAAAPVIVVVSGDGVVIVVVGLRRGIVAIPCWAAVVVPFHRCSVLGVGGLVWVGVYGETTPKRGPHAAGGRCAES